MIEGADELLAIAEIALALAGFAALVIVLGTRGTSVHATTAALTQSLALIALGVGLLCLVPIVLARLGVEGAGVWRMSCACGAVTGAVFGAPAVLVSARRVLASEAGPELPSAPRIGGTALRVLVSLPLLPWTVFASLAIGWPATASLGGLLLGVFLLLATVGLQFFWAIMSLLHVDRPARGR